MIVIKIELWPHGIRKKSREIGRIVIANDGTGTPTKGNYKVSLSHAGSYAKKVGAWKSGKITGHLRKLSPYHLVQSAIAAALKGKSTKESSELIEMTKDGNKTPGETYLENLVTQHIEYIKPI